MKPAQVEDLTRIFAKLRRDGVWHIPVWLNVLRLEVGLDPMPAFFVLRFPL